MISKTLEKELSAYRIGEKVKELRTERGLRLVELGSHTGMSAAMLSKIETGKLVPTLPTLMRIALVFSVGLDYFFGDERRRKAFAITRKGERIKLPAALDKKLVPYDFESLDYAALEPKLNAFLATFRELERLPSHQHNGVEFIYLISGRLEITWSGTAHVLEAGDSVYFDSGVEHGYRRLGKDECTGVVITLPG
ncbi:MAG: helix-turn-helix transcriptional regulator [Planctomycetes bacterium]|nr:helix-turn-helix transcriptional regulator [Planctomycetota bacterium]